jgi:hypothetical protein
MEIDLVVLNLHLVHKQHNFATKTKMPIRNGLHGIPYGVHGLIVNWWLLCSQVIAARIVGPAICL